MSTFLDNALFRIGAGALASLLFGLFCWQGIQQPSAPYFDETHYVAAAKSYQSGNFSVNREHPPLGKKIIAWGISWLGDRPEGWRAMGCLFGAGTLFALYLWSLLLFPSVGTGLFVVAVTAMNQLLYVQSRIAMLDSIMAFFLVAAMVCFTFWMTRQKSLKALILGSVFLGVALATKWFALIPIAAVGATISWSSRRDGRKALRELMVFGAVVFAAYFACFPWGDFWGWQLEIWNGQRSVPAEHPYASPWWEWPLQLRPMWYAYEPVPSSEQVRGVFLIGNPWVLWAGVLSLFWCAREAWVGKSFSARMILVGFLVCWLSWAVIPRELTFFFYYFPASLLLGLSLAQGLRRSRRLLWAFALVAFWFFVYFLPVLDASPRSPQEMQKRQWFQSWV